MLFWSKRMPAWAGSIRGGRRICIGRCTINLQPCRVWKRASISSTVPFGTRSVHKSVQRAGKYPASGAKPTTAAEGMTFSPWWNSVGADYFATVGLPLLRGRAFTEAEANQPGGPPVAIIDEEFAKKLWPDGDALGQRIQFPVLEIPAALSAVDTGEIKRGDPIEVIGIVPTTRNRLLSSRMDGSIYLPFARGFQNNVFFLRPLQFASCRAMKPPPPIFSAGRCKASTRYCLFSNCEPSTITWSAVRSSGLSGPARRMFSVFGGLALGLSVVGVYGVKAYAVARRTREIGIRMALGAQARNRAMDDPARRRRHGRGRPGPGTSPRLWHRENCQQHSLSKSARLDPFAFTLAPAVLAIAALLATWLPARRATKISPMAALRTE